MLRVGLTGGLGSGKSTVGAMLARRGAHVMDADAIGRSLMRRSETVYAAIVERFGPGVVRADGELDRAELARLAFGEGRVEELNAIVHPAVIARQGELTEEIAARDAGAVVVVESALIFETKFGKTEFGGTASGREDGWRRRFDQLVLVTAPEELRVERFVRRAVGGRAAGAEELAAMRAEAWRRLARQMPDSEKERRCDHVVRNDGTMAALEAQMDSLWASLRAEADARGGKVGTE